jgi:hypothetical protein
MKTEKCTCTRINKFELKLNGKCPVHFPAKFSLSELKIAYTKGWQDRAFTGDRTEFNSGAFDVRLEDFIQSVLNSK